VAVADEGEKLELRIGHMLVETNSGGTSVHYPVRDATRELVTLVSGIDHPECVAWHQGAVYAARSPAISSGSPPESGEVEVVASTGGFLLGIAFDQAGACVACDTGRAELLRIQASGSVEVIAGSVQGRKLVSPNYPVVASDGTIWATESGSGWDTDNGYLFCVRPGSCPYCRRGMPPFSKWSRARRRAGGDVRRGRAPAGSLTLRLQRRPIGHAHRICPAAPGRA